METYTIKEAARHCGMNHRALARRVSRGSVRSVKDSRGFHKIPRAELESVGLWPGSEPKRPGRTEADGSTTSLVQLGQENEQLHAELAQMRIDLAAALARQQPALLLVTRLREMERKMALEPHAAYDQYTAAERGQTWLSHLAALLRPSVRPSMSRRQQRRERKALARAGRGS